MACCGDNIKVGSCCFCISLQTGAKIIGFFVLFGGILSLIVNLFGTFVVYDDDPLSTNNEATTEHPFASIYQQFHNNASSMQEEESPVVEWIAAVIIVLLDLIIIAIAIVLLVGAFRKMPRLLKTFCIVALVLVLLQLIFRILINAVVVFHAETDVGIYLNFLVDLYWILVVKSAYHEMKEELVRQRGQGGQVYRYNDNTQMNQLKPLNP